MRIIFSFITSILLLGCSSGITVSIPEHYEAPPAQERGYLTGSLSATTVWPSSGEGLVTTLYIRQTGDEDAIALINDNSSADFSTESLTGQLFSIPLPAGEYELFCVGFKGSNGRKTISSKSNEDLGLTFTIEPGKISYIGQFTASSLVAKSTLWNQEYPSGYGYITHNYANERDKALFFERHPDLIEMNFTPKTLPEINNRLISTKP